VRTLPPIVYFGNDWFADNRTSSHHMARELSRHTRLLYVECPGLRVPRGTARDLRRIASKLRRGLQRPSPVHDNLSIATLTQLPLHGSAIAHRLNGAWGEAMVRRAVRAERIASPIVWCTVPHVAGLVRRLGWRPVIYHCIDEYASLPGVDAQAVTNMDDALSRMADLVVAASRPVFERKTALNRCTLLLPHGVDFEHFARARNGNLPRPRELAGLHPPVVGFFGLIEDWIDLDLVGWLAAELPHVTFVMIGRIGVSDDAVPRRPNILFLGPRPYETLPAYGAHFDAAIIPYKLTAQVMAANPLKLREYLAMGLPTVSVSTPEIDQFVDVVAVAATREEFRQALVDAVARGSDETAIARRMDRARATTWHARVDQLLPHVERVLDALRGAVG
jgi:glycosyltransferase involved in cell wall biosynthesis